MGLTQEDVLERVVSEPGATQLLALAPPGAFLVGGAVRDMLLGRRPRELDVVLAGSSGDSPPYEGAVARLARELAASVAGGRAPSVAGGGAASLAAGGAASLAGGGAASLAAGGAASLAGGGASVAVGGVAQSEHERFDTAIVEWDGGRIDVAAARRERYSRPGALPEVEPASLAEDLLRRDFAINAIAVGLAGDQRGALHAAPHALQDLRAGQLRVLHERSFLDDPTRLWRLARYRARLGFEVEAHTAELAAEAIAGGALATVSGARIGAELRLALGESDPSAALAELDRLGVLGALHPRLRVEPELVRRGLELLGADRGRADAGPGREDVLSLAALTLPLALRAEGDRGGEIATLLDRLEFAAAVRDGVVASAVAVPDLIDALAEPLCPSELRAAVLRMPPEGVALAGALGERAAAAARRWLGELRHIRLRIGGEDLLEHGIREGPDVGRRLEQTLRMRLDGELPDEREAQLRAALAA
jgi:tRNA nucleotidyltransferase (CCA-adding enzyme)